MPSRLGDSTKRLSVRHPSGSLSVRWLLTFGPMDAALRSPGDCSLSERQAGVPMCFSATASFVTVGITATAGIVCLTRIRGWRELPLASLPLIFAGQQAVEGFLWLALPVDPNGPVSSMLTLIFLLYAKVVWPAFAPIAALLIEPEPGRRRLMAICAAIGAGWQPISYGRSIPILMLQAFVQVTSSTRGNPRVQWRLEFFISWRPP